jgi:hypothetical protein
MALGRIVRANGGRNSTLRVARASGAGIRLGEDEDVAMRRQFDGRTQPGNPAPDDQKIG